MILAAKDPDNIKRNRCSNTMCPSLTRAGFVKTAVCGSFSTTRSNVSAINLLLTDHDVLFLKVAKSLFSLITQIAELKTYL